MPNALLCKLCVIFRHLGVTLSNPLATVERDPACRILMQESRKRREVMRVLRKTSIRRGQRRVRGESGQGLAEYALILALIALVCVGAFGTLGGAIAASPAWTIFNGI